MSKQTGDDSAFGVAAGSASACPHTKKPPFLGAFYCSLVDVYLPVSTIPPPQASHANG